MKRENRYRIDYIGKLTGGLKSCFPRSEEKKDEQLALCQEKGIEVVRCVKLYPFNTEKHQHDFMLIANRCANQMYDMESGASEWNDKEYEQLSGTKELADELFSLELPIAWVDGKTLQKCKELSFAASSFRAERCVANGRYDLLEYC